MRLATIRVPGRTAAARIDGETAAVLPYSDVGALLAVGDWRRAAEVDAVETIPVAECDFAPVVPTPEKIACVGHNYVSHIREMGRPLPDHPTLFAKYWRALTGPRDDIALPRSSTQVDWEAELAIVVGAPLRHADPATAAAAIAGFTVMNDVSVRDWQMRTPQWLAGKTFEAATPLGPWLVTPDEVDGARDLTVTCEVNGEVVQQASTADLLFGPAAILSYLSEIVTLVPGDVVATGTPGGVGHACDPPRYLQAGDIVRTSIGGVGELVNRVVAPAA